MARRQWRLRHTRKLIQPSENNPVSLHEASLWRLSRLSPRTLISASPATVLSVLSDEPTQLAQEP